jgi:glycosyltransferase involved in cell wall biosynthesis
VRLVLLTDDGPADRGGVATWVRRVARAAVARGDHVVVASRRGGGELAGGVHRAIGGPSFGRWGGVWAQTAWREVLAADLVVAATWPLATQWVRWGVPVAVVAHGSDVTTPTRDPRGRRRVFELADRWFAVSAWVAAHVPRRVTVLPAPVEPATPGRGGGGWGFVGRAVEEKGGDTFVRWVAAAGVRGCVVGDGPHLGRWRSVARELGADVEFVGWLPPREVRDRTRSWDLLCAPSRTRPDGSGGEGLSLAVLEAAAAAVPAVVTDVGGLPEAAGAEGLVVRAEAGADEVVAAVRRWWSPERGAAARARVARGCGAGRAVEGLTGR